MARAFNSRKQVFVKMFQASKSTTDSRMMQKFPTAKTKGILNDLIRKLKKTADRQIELGPAVVVAVREHTKTLRSFFA